jgi:sterol desaturase/sphingolipid hydroxylase (fatty acid hydroxylase superfamily)
MCSALLLFFIFRHTGDNSITATYISIVVPSLAILLFEVYLPYKKEWKPVAADWKNDSISLVAIQMLLPKLLVWLSIHYILTFLHTNELTFNNAWPHHLPIGVQVIIVILISDLLRYWLHRFSHTFHFLWRLHAVHHSVQKLYWLNTSRFHPLEKSLQFMLDVLPFMILGVSEEVIAVHYVLYAVNGFFQHCNIDLKYGWLNYVVSSSEHHRWHHSRNPEESNNNYGNNVIIWDILFGSFYLPPDKEVHELGLINKNYPLDFARQLKTPLFNKYDKIDMPELSIGQYFLNILFRIRMIFIGFAFKDLVESTKKCDGVQLNLLRKIVSSNRHTSFGKAHSFEAINNYDDYKKFLPISEYDVLRPYIEKQSADQTNKAIVNDEIIMFNKTSGTTSHPKYIPVTSETLKALKKSQSFLSYVQYKLQADYFIGKLAGIVSPAVEGQTEDKILYGAASGHFYKSMPAIIRFKYALPYEVFEIADYESKYYCILLLLLQHRDITYFGSANPTTYLKLIEILNSRKTDLLHDLKSRTLNSVKIADSVKTKVILRSLKPSKSRLLELEGILSSSDKITFKELWPYIKLLTTWTSGSCGVALKTVLNVMPDGVKVVDPGYLSSEARGTFTFDVNSQSGMLTFHDNFFEFVERRWIQSITYLLPRNRDCTDII